jgi:hypothetical protein
MPFDRSQNQIGNVGAGARVVQGENIWINETIRSTLYRRCRGQFTPARYPTFRTSTAPARQISNHSRRC